MKSGIQSGKARQWGFRLFLLFLLILAAEGLFGLKDPPVIRYYSIPSFFAFFTLIFLIVVAMLEGISSMPWMRSIAAAVISLIAFFALWLSNFPPLQEDYPPSPRMNSLTVAALSLIPVRPEPNVCIVTNVNHYHAYWDETEQTRISYNYFYSLRITYPEDSIAPTPGTNDVILLDLGNGQCSDALGNLSISKLNYWKSHLNSRGLMIVVLPTSRNEENIIRRTFQSHFMNQWIMQFDETRYLLASNTLRPIKTIEELERLAALLNLYDDYGKDTMPNHSVQFLLGLTHRDLRQEANDYDPVKIKPNCMENPTLLRASVSSKEGILQGFLKFTERFGLILFGALLASYLILRYFISWNLVRKAYFQNLENFFLYTGTMFFIPYLTLFWSPCSWASWWKQYSIFDLNIRLDFVKVLPLLFFLLFLFLPKGERLKRTNISRFERFFSALSLLVCYVCMFQTRLVWLQWFAAIVLCAFQFLCAWQFCREPISYLPRPRAVTGAVTGAFLALIVWQILLFCPWGPIVFAALLLLTGLQRILFLL